MRYIVHAISNVRDLFSKIPQLEVCSGNIENEFDIFIKSVQLAGFDSCVHIQDSLIVCENFCQEAESIISRYSDAIIQFYSVNKDDLRYGSRWISSGRNWAGGCYYIPSEINRKLVQYFNENKKVIVESGDIVQWVGKFLAKSNIKYFNACPNLADLNGTSLTFGKERKRIEITCDAKFSLPLSEIAAFQRGLKRRNQKQVDHIVTSILQNGFSFPMFIWKHNNENHCLDGHGRILALLELERRGFVIPNIPVVYVEADNEREARRKLIEINSVNGVFSKQGLLDFIKDLDIDYGELNIPGVNLKDIENMFKVKYDPTFDIKQISDDDIEEAKENLGNKINVVVQNLKDSHTFRDLSCPNCKCEFSIEQK
ncbi:MAG: ParB N-terminal domain-containing protein [Bacteroidales bacterium]|jgi:hypothetical protein|nr:ParB N-terminal domain-containing protein [Bacteroidales bacterium]